MKRKILILTLLLFSLAGHGQRDTISSLRRQFATEKVDSVKYRVAFTLGNKYADYKRDSAVYFFDKCIQIARKTKNVKFEMRAYNRLARIHFDLHHYSKALEFSLYNLGLAETNQDTVAMYFETRLQMWIYSNVQDYDKQLEYARKLYKLADSKALRNSRVSALAYSSAYNGIGKSYQNIKRYDSAYANFKKSLKIRDSTGKNPQLPVVATYLGEYFLKRKQYDSAMYYEKLALRNYENRLDMKSEMEYGIANLYFIQKNLDSASSYARNSLFLARTIPDSSTMARSAFLLADVYRLKNRKDSAYYYLSEAVAIQKQLDAKEELNKAGAMLFKKNMHRQEMEQQKLRDEHEYKSNLKIYALVGGIAVLLLVSLLLFRNNKRRQKDATRIRTSYEKLRTTQAQLIQAEKMASLGELTAGIAHEIQNPLNFVNNFSDVSRELISEILDERRKTNDEQDEELVNDILSDIDQNLEKITHHGKRADAIVKGMLQHSRTSSGTKELTDINALTNEFLRLSYHGIRAKDKTFNATVKTEFDENLDKIDVVAQDVGRVILNLLTNAFYAVQEKQKTPTTKSYEPTVFVGTEKLGDTVLIRVRDNGNGIPKPIIDKIFQPFFTTKPTGEGTGLGLSLSYDIVKAHGGELQVKTAESEGTEFTIVLPLTIKNNNSSPIL